MGPEAAGTFFFSSAPSGVEAVSLKQQPPAIAGSHRPPGGKMPAGSGGVEEAPSPAELLTLHHARGQCRFYEPAAAGFVGLGGA